MTMKRKGIFGGLFSNDNSSDKFDAEELFANDEPAPRQENRADPFDSYQENSRPPAPPQEQREAPPAQRTYAVVEAEYNQTKKAYLDLIDKVSNIKNYVDDTNKTEDAAAFNADQAEVRRLDLKVRELERERNEFSNVRQDDGAKARKYAESFLNAYLNDPKSPMSGLNEDTKKAVSNAYYAQLDTPQLSDALIDYSSRGDKGSLKSTLYNTLSLIYGRMGLSNAQLSSPAPARGLGNMPDSQPVRDQQEKAWAEKGFAHRGDYPTDDPDDAGALIYDYFEQVSRPQMSVREYNRLQREKGNR